MRILGLDYGEKRIGVALSDELGIAAHGLTVIQRKGVQNDIHAIEELVSTNGVENIVIGYPVRLNGEEGISCQKVNEFILLLEKNLMVPIIREDEIFTTMEAQTVLRETKTKRKKRKEVIDKIAACFILQTYLNRLSLKKHEREEDKTVERT